AIPDARVVVVRPATVVHRDIAARQGAHRIPAGRVIVVVPVAAVVDVARAAGVIAAIPTVPMIVVMIVAATPMHPIDGASAFGMDESRTKEDRCTQERYS